MELYHVLNRGVDKRRIFMDDGDRVRFVHDMYEFNDVRPANNTSRNQMNDIGCRSSGHTPLVEIHGWCLMDNHYHLLLSGIAENGIARFMRKLNVGYARFFNDKHKRSGFLFQGSSKRILIERDAHFLHILNYIHLNPLDTLPGAKGWRAGEIRDPEKARAHLSQYRWSSYMDYCGRKNFPSILTTELFGDMFGDYGKMIARLLRDREPIDDTARTLE